jgi:hypothetical protein
VTVAPAFGAYLAAWTATCVLALVLAVRDRAVRSDAMPYARCLLVPWKLAVFAPAAIFVTFAGQFAHDDTWDRVTGAGMSILTYLTAPWVVGTLWLVAKGRRPRRHLAVAVPAALFSASWFYDGWLLYRDGSYPNLWFWNLVVSSYLYAAAGFLWNLEVDAAGKLRLGFTRPNWPAPPFERQFHPALLLAILPPVALAAAILLGSVRWRVWE